MIPVFIVVFYLPIKWNNQIACFIFVLAAVTDILDGYLARKLNQISSLGAFLDPVADKLMITVVLVLLVEQDPTPFLALPAAVIIGREITISALRDRLILSPIKLEFDKQSKRMTRDENYRIGSLQ